MDFSSRLQRSEVLQSLTWKGYEFLKLLFQPADFFAQLNVIHPAKTQTKPLRERLAEQKFKASRATPSQHQKAMHSVPAVGSTDLSAFPRETAAHFISELLLELYGLCHWLLAMKKFHHSTVNEPLLKPGTSTMR